MPSWGFLIVVNILLLVAGNFMEPTGIILILAPILFPIATRLGIDPIHLGVIMVVNMEIGMVTPPVLPPFPRGRNIGGKWGDGRGPPAGGPDPFCPRGGAGNDPDAGPARR